MNFTLDELINAIKYHGHQYDLTTLEILEGITRQIESDNEALEEQHEKELDELIEQAIDNERNKIDDKIDGLLENRLFELEDEGQKEVIKKFRDDVFNIVFKRK